MKTIRNRVVAMLMLFASIAVFQPAYANIDTLSIQHQKTGKEYVFSSVAITNLVELRSLLKGMNLSQHTEVLQAMMMVETRAGTGGAIGLPNAHPEHRSYGLMQVTVPTARDTLRRFPQLFDMFFAGRTLSKVSDKEIKNLLLKNTKANILLGIHVFVLYLDMVNGDIERAIAGYNMGIGNALKRKNAPRAKYVQDVKVWVPTLVAFNREYDVMQTKAPETFDQYVVDIDETLVDNHSIMIPITEEQDGQATQGTQAN